MKLPTVTRHHNPSSSPRQPAPDRLAWVACAAKLLVGSLLAQSLGMPVWAGPLPLAGQPAGTAGREPAPNVIISIDDSGSMAGDVEGEYGKKNPSKMTLLQNALNAEFGNPEAIPPTLGRIEDNRIRLAWQSMWNKGVAGNLSPGQANSMSAFAGTHRKDFNDFVVSLTPGGATPSHKMMANVRKYMGSAENKNSPWADNPGTAQTTPYMACRRTYHIFMTDGGWNSAQGPYVDNADGTARTLPDGKRYDPITSDQVRAYSDIWGAGNPNTLADSAFFNWATDFQDGNNGTQNMPNNVRPLIRRSGTETIGGVPVQEYWNPKNNPATWQSATQYTIGFGNGASKWPGDPKWDKDTDNNYGGDFPKLVNGSVTWRDPVNNGADEDDRPFELWHMALNGRGKFYPARDANALQAAFADILDNVINDTSIPVVSIATNSTRLSAGSLSYLAGYKAGEWSGSLKAYKVTAAGFAASADWNATDLLDATTFNPNNRVVLSFDGTNGIPFRYNSLPSIPPATQRLLLAGTDGRGSQRVDYVRGDRSGEGTDPNTFRTRTSRLGDIVNSNLWYVGPPRSASRLTGYAAFAAAKVSRTPMLYIGANDGMLHGFEAATGTERIAYVPEGIYSRFVNLTSQNYTHKYLVDGSPFSGDVLVGGASPWKTYLAGFMGGGGKGYFVLDVTDPTITNFTENNASSLVVLDTTATTDPDIGSIFGQPSKELTNASVNVQFAMMNNGRPALIVGNGINSTSERPVLLIQYLNGAKELVKLVASALPGLSNGLSTPQIIDLNNDGKADLVYAGDLKGNLWKFDISSATASNWKVAFAGNPLFTATSSTSVAQPIMTAPVWLHHPKGGIMLGFGTGRNVTIGDRTDSAEQTFYAIWDNSTLSISGTNIVSVTDDALKRITNGRTSLVQQTMSTTAVTSFAGRSFYNYTANLVNYDSTGVNPNRRGWYMNFSEPLERASTNPYWFSSGNLVVIPSAIPAAGTDSNTETCSLLSNPEVGFLTVVDLIRGAAPKTPVFDTDGGGFTGSEVLTSKVSNMSESTYLRTGTTQGILLCTTCTSTLGVNQFTVPGITTGWRER